MTVGAVKRSSPNPQPRHPLSCSPQLRSFMTPPTVRASCVEQTSLEASTVRVAAPAKLVSAADQQTLTAQAQEIASLRAQLEKATKVNEELWKVAVEGAGGPRTGDGGTSNGNAKADKGIVQGAKSKRKK